MVSQPRIESKCISLPGTQFYAESSGDPRLVKVQEDFVDNDGENPGTIWSALPYTSHLMDPCRAAPSNPEFDPSLINNFFGDGILKPEGEISLRYKPEGEICFQPLLLRAL